MNRHNPLRALAVIFPLLAGMAAAETPNRVTILYDSFGKSPSLTMDWGFAALVEYGGKRILFDTGNNCRPSDCFPARAHAREKALTWLNSTVSVCAGRQTELSERTALF